MASPVIESVARNDTAFPAADVPDTDTTTLPRAEAARATTAQAAAKAAPAKDFQMREMHMAGTPREGCAASVHGRCADVRCGANDSVANGRAGRTSVRATLRRGFAKRRSPQQLVVRSMWP